MFKYKVYLKDGLMPINVISENEEGKIQLASPFNKNFVLLGDTNNICSNVILRLKLKEKKNEITAKFISIDITSYIYPVDNTMLKFLFSPSDKPANIYSTLLAPINNIEYIKFVTNNCTRMLLLNSNKLNRIEKTIF